MCSSSKSENPARKSGTQSMCLSGAAAKPAAKVAAKPAAEPAAGEPIPVTPVEHVQRFKVEYSCQKKWHTEHVSQWT